MFENAVWYRQLPDVSSAIHQVQNKRLRKDTFEKKFIDRTKVSPQSRIREESEACQLSCFNSYTCSRFPHGTKRWRMASRSAKEISSLPDCTGGDNSVGRLPRQAKVFDFLVKVDQGLHKKTPLKEFKRELDKRYREAYPEAILPDDVTLDRLYERLLDANVERIWVILAKKLSRSPAWKNHREWVDKVAELASQLSIDLTAGNPGFLPASDYKTARSLSVSIRRLTRNLRDLQRFDRRVDDIAETHNWNSSLRNARLRLDRLLNGKCPSLTKEQRAELIATATELVGLKEEETLAAVIRALGRARAAAARKKSVNRRPH